MPHLDERVGLAVLAVGAAVALAGVVWLVRRLLPLFRDLVVRGFRPALVILLGVAIAASPVVLNKLAGKPNDKAVARGEVLGLTGADRAEYAVLRADKSFAVVQWANPDVTDDDVEALRGMDALRELDLNSSQVTDRSLAVIATLPRLESLRLLGTRITDDGFRTHLLPLPNLKRLDLTNTAVKGPTAREWKAARPDRELVR
jgi:Leucine-rich repeat (LRR) protein